MSVPLIEDGGWIGRPPNTKVFNRLRKQRAPPILTQRTCKNFRLAQNFEFDPNGYATRPF
jgi:hypothetical protein